MARTILLADDSVTAQNMGRRILSDAGYEVITVNNGSAALKKIAELKPDLIVLDVYMPGYGGLEVCQRLKESQATSRIPVLLTVGKLEPFKVEEARRVRADAHIVKPFDSTELLAAIIKLEDKIVPQPASGKQSRSAKASSNGEATATRRSREKSADPGTETSSGWKKRLSFPRSAPASEVAAAENNAKIDSPKFQDFKKEEEPQPTEAKLPEAPVMNAASEQATVGETLASTRPFENFTVERLMAIETAAPVINPAPVVEESAVLESVAASVDASVPESAGEPVAASDAEPVATDLVPALAETAPISKAVSEEQSPSEAEVMAALASLAPVGGELSQSTPGFSESAIASPIDSGLKFNRVAEEIPVDALASALVAVGGMSSGPRWIAEAVPLSDGDAHLILESEMEKVYASFSAAASVQTIDSSQTVPDAIEITPVALEQSSPPENLAEPFASELPAVDPNASLATAEASIAANDSAIPAELAPEPMANHELNPAASAEFSETKVPSSDEITSIGYREIAYAAAASAGSQISPEAGRTEHSSAVDFPVAASETIVENADISQRAGTPAEAEQLLPAALNSIAEVAASHGESQQHESQVDAAWQDWRQIRDSVVGPQLTTQIADAAAAGFRQLRGEETIQTEPQEADAAAAGKAAEQAAAQASTIASIVDSVFAELKPKLMEEIAKKLAADRK